MQWFTLHENKEGACTLNSKPGKKYDGGLTRLNSYHHTKDWPGSSSLKLWPKNAQADALHAGHSNVCQLVTNWVPRMCDPLKYRP